MQKPTLFNESDLVRMMRDCGLPVDDQRLNYIEILKHHCGLSQEQSETVADLMLPLSFEAIQDFMQAQQAKPEQTKLDNIFLYCTGGKMFFEFTAFDNMNKEYIFEFANLEELQGIIIDLQFFHDDLSGKED